MAPRRPRTPMIAPTPTSSSNNNNSPPRPSPTSSTALPTLQTTPPATATPLSFLRSVVSAETVPHHLVLTTLALLLASGLIVRRLHNKNRYRAPPPTPKGIKKRKQDVVKSILIAQSQEEGSNVASTSSPSKARPRSGSTTPTVPHNTSNSTLLPSSACVVSTSAAIWNNLEKVGAALLSSTSRSTNQKNAREESSSNVHAQTVSETPKAGKEPVSLSKDGVRKGKNKKGKGVAAGSTTPTNTKVSSSDMSRASSKQGMKEEKGGIRKTDQGVQVSQVDVESSSTGRSDQTTPTTITQNPPRPVPPSSSDPPIIPTKTTVAVQTSPRLLPCRPHSPPPPASSPLLTAVAPIETSSPAPIRPIAVPISFDLHASFQATPSPSSITVKEESRSTSPSLSSTPSRSPSISPSVSSGSPTGRRLSSTSTSLTSNNGGKSRKQSKKAGSTGLNGKTIVGLPKPAEKPEEDVLEDQKPTSSKSRANGRERPSPIPIPSNSSRQQPVPAANDSTPQPQRRLSTASSSAYSNSNFSLTSSGSPYSADRVALPLMPPAMTMTPPDFARRPSSTATYDRDETLKWSSSTSTSSRGREASLRGLGVDLDRDRSARGVMGVDSEDGSVEGIDGRLRNGGSVRGTSPKPPSQGYFQSQPPFARHSSFASPDSSPHPVPRTLTPFDTPSPSHHPWLSQASISSASMGPNSTLIPYPIASSASRPPSRQTSLSVPLNSSQQQHINLQQQQQAYAIAQVQAQAAAQYQHVVALQYQAQLQQQSQQRRKLGEEETFQQPNGLVYPLSSSTTSNHSQPPSNWPPSGGNSHSASPMNSNYPHSHPHLSQAVSPTSMTFAGSNTMSPHTQAQMYQSYINQSAAYYLAASSNSPHSSPNQHHVQQQQQQQPIRPRINSSVSAVAVLSGGGGGASSNNRNGSVSSPVSANSLASPRLNGTEKGRQGSSSLFSSLGPGSGVGGGTSLGDVAIAWKARAKEAEMEADRNAKELEIARWRLSVLEGEQQANEIENQEALRALATRAMRAEARIKLLEETRKSDSSAQASPPTNPIDSSPSPSPAAVSPSAPRPMELPSNVSVETSWRSFGEGDSSVGGPGSGLHPLSWLDLDSISFSTRPLNSSTSASSRPPLNQSHSSSSNNRKRAGRNSHGNGNGNGNGRRQSGNHNGRRKSSNNNNNPLSPSLHLSVPSPTTDSAPSSPNRRSGNEEDEREEEDEEDIVIVLNSSSRRSVRSPSRRSSYAASTVGADESLLSGPNGTGGGDASSFIDEDDIPTIEFDSDPTSSRLQLVHPQIQAGGGGNSSSDSQNGSVTGGGIEEDEQHVDWVGFLPGFLARVRASSANSLGAAPRVSIEEEEEEEEEEEGDLLGSPRSLPAFDDNNFPVSEEDTTTPEARVERTESKDAYSFHGAEEDEKSQTSPSLEILAPPIPFHSTPPQSPSTFAFSAREGYEGEANSTRSPPPPLYHPFPIRPSQIALPASPTTPIDSPPPTFSSP
ncbi:hypothetical protein JCM5350_001379 [Sporobolomyces pararoseus]